MSTQPNFLESFILVDSTLVAGGVSLLFILLNAIPARVVRMSSDHCSLQLTLLSLSLNERDYISCFALSVLAS